jgi:hypothetical protein
MLNDLTLHEACTIVTMTGASIRGTYGGVETPHGDWSVLVSTDRRTISIPMGSIATATPLDG